MRSVVAAGALLLLAAPRAPAQGWGLADVEFDAGVGRSQVNKQAWIAGGQLLTSNLLASGGDGRLFVYSSRVFRLGVEFGYHYYFSYQAIFSPNAVIRDVDADHMSFVGRIMLTPRLAFDAGGGIQFFDGFNDIGLQSALRYYIPVNPNLSIPIGIRADFVLDSNALLVPVVLTAGFAVRP